MDNIWLGQFSENGLAANLDPYYAKWNAASDISDAYVASSKWNGSQYGVWAYSDIRLFVWNKDVFPLCGLDPEKAPTTWQEVMDDAAAIKAKVRGVTPVGFPAGSFEATVDRVLFLPIHDRLEDPRLDQQTRGVQRRRRPEGSAVPRRSS